MIFWLLLLHISSSVGSVSGHVEVTPSGVAVDFEGAHADVQVDSVDRIVVIEIAAAFAFL